jgi:hypothetical protein
MKSLPLSLKTLSLAALLCTAAVAHADITVYTDRASFLAAVGLPGTDTFDDLAVQPYASPLTRTAGAYGYLASAGPATGFFPAGSGTDIWLSPETETDAITFSSFASGVRGFGGNFFGSDVNGAFSPGRTLALAATDGTTTRTVTLENTTTTTFLGFVSSDPLLAVALTAATTAADPYWASANDVTLAVPEPASLGMLVAGLGLVGFAARRRAG